MHTYTYSFSLLEVSSETWEDVRKRIEAAGEANEYINYKEGLIILGTVALKKEKNG